MAISTTFVNETIFAFNAKQIANAIFKMVLTTSNDENETLNQTFLLGVKAKLTTDSRSFRIVKFGKSYY